MHIINCQGQLLLLDSPKVMGIINVTSNSFYKGFLEKSPNEILQVAEQMLAAGATILDVGGQTTKPGSLPLSAEEEAERILPVIRNIKKTFPQAIVSVDTFYATVARLAVGEGAAIVNDVSGGNWDNNMLDTVAALGVPYICMHMQGTPETMQQNPFYDDLIDSLLTFFIERVALCRAKGIKDVIIDPGFGFGKTIAHNFEILNQLQKFEILNVPILAGLSRKSTIYKTLQVTPDDALNGTTVLNTIALLNGANLLRVHDVKEAVETVKLVKAYQQFSH